MANRKFNAQQLFTGYAMLGPESVLITDESGIVEDIVMAADAGDGIEQFEGIVSPGFINCHCHLELSHMHGAVPRNTGMINFLLSVVNNRNAGEQNISDAIKAAEKYMKERGVVAVGDICNTSHSLEIKKAGGLYYHNFIEALGFSDINAEHCFDVAHKVYLKFRNEDPTHNSSIVPHSPYSVSDSLFDLINSYEKGSLLSIHNQESVAETEFLQPVKVN